MPLTQAHFIILGIVLLLALCLTFAIWETGVVLKRKVQAGKMTVSRAQLLLGLLGLLTSLALPGIILGANRGKWFGFEMNMMAALFAIMGALIFGMVIQLAAYLVFGVAVSDKSPKTATKTPDAPAPPA